MPQERCNRWESNSRGGYQRAKEGDSQYRNVLIGGSIGIGFAYKIESQWAERLRAVGVDGADKTVGGY